MAFFRERKRQEAMVAKESDGESLWTEDFSEQARIRIWRAFEGAFQVQPAPAWATTSDPWANICGSVRSKILIDEGLVELTGQFDAHSDVSSFLMRCDNDSVGTVIEAMWATMVEVAQKRWEWLHPNRSFPASLNEALYRERVAYEFIGNHLIARSSEELHTAVVRSSLRLLAGRPDWLSVDTAYRKALDEIAGGSADDAITDVGSALQEALTLLGCKGNSLGPLIRSARDAGILAPHDSTLTEGIVKILAWVSADRSELGDGHQGASGATREDAWFTVHVVGALILRLAEGPRAK